MYRDRRRKIKLLKTHFGQNTKILVSQSVEYEMNGNVMGVVPG